MIQCLRISDINKCRKFQNHINQNEKKQFKNDANAIQNDLSSSHRHRNEFVKNFFQNSSFGEEKEFHVI